MKKEEYFYFEWLIVEKNITLEIYSLLSNRKIFNLIKEYELFKNSINSLC
jgi:hypothetical protein